jgi:hypothetical protein
MSHEHDCEPRGPGQSLTDYKLDQVLGKLAGIEDCLFGDDAGRDGLKLDVDRLKRSRATHNAVLWVIFTTLLGVAGTVIAGIIHN